MSRLLLPPPGLSDLQQESRSSLDPECPEPTVRGPCLSVSPIQRNGSSRCPGHTFESSHLPSFVPCSSEVYPPWDHGPHPHCHCAGPCCHRLPPGLVQMLLPGLPTSLCVPAVLPQHTERPCHTEADVSLCCSKSPQLPDSCTDSRSPYSCERSA